MNYPQNLKKPFNVYSRERAEELAQSAAGCFEMLKTWKRRYTTRRHLARAEARTLRDVGVSEARRAAEIGKPFWVA